MDKSTKVIIRYESARQLVSTLKAKRSQLISECENLGEIPCQSGYGTVETGTTCLSLAYDVLMTTLNENPGEGYSYEEILTDEQCGGRVCDSCYEAYEIKVGPLRDARGEFGNAKRQMSRIGKKLIKENDK